MLDYKGKENILEYLSNLHMYVFYPKDDRIGYNIECDCTWEPEQQCSIIIRENEVLYAGPSEGFNAWSDGEFFCIWEDQLILTPKFIRNKKRNILQRTYQINFIAIVEMSIRMKM